LFGERARHGAQHPDTGLVLRRHVAGYYSAVDRSEKLPSPKLTKASVSNALSAALDLGLTVSSMDIQPDGSMRVEFGAQAEMNHANSNTRAGSKSPKKWGENK
ncbi:hypothetical protein, partial [Roseivivax halotolerans]|uniref:hypothetical protein n=1 Tax=Roseivivax halotolerans TaxID=93684 RepID=UPI001587ABE8